MARRLPWLYLSGAYHVIDHEIFFIPVDGAPQAWLPENYLFYIEFVIPAEVYSTAVPTETVGLVNILLTHEDVPD
ncbi:MAG: TAXI family TRAP transporter solute-binding subunit [Oscillospiraceae bacterium]|nr:TAXI family TRAP transporter solute-binding subunit [Oscillospiraceae bacterium]